MSRRFAFHALTLVTVVLTAFVFRACGTGRPMKEDTRVGEVSGPPRIQIGLTRVLRDPAVRLRAPGGADLRGAKGSLGRLPAGEWVEVRCDVRGIVAGGESKGEPTITISPGPEAPLEVEVTRDFRGGAVKPHAARYAGDLVVHALPEGRLAVVNDLDLETYLYGVVGREMNLAEGEEALKAQVIAARTYAVHEQRLDRVRRVKGEKFDLYDDERSQVYGGLERSTPLARRLVDETRGMFLTWEGKLVRTFYSSACGGHTEPAWEVLQDETERMPPLAGTRCDYCQRRPIYKWKEPVLVPKKEIAEKCLPRDLQGARVRGLEITKTLPGGHAQEITLTLENSSRTVKLQANQEFRRTLSARFRSLLWDVVEDRGEAFAVFGRGYGHGAGMCQTGAYELAREGKTGSEILEYYFPTARVRKLY
jgi:stage II sporulation protein D